MTVVTKKLNLDGASCSGWKINADCNKKCFFFDFLEKYSYEPLPKPELKNISSYISSHYFELKF